MKAGVTQVVTQFNPARREQVRTIAIVRRISVAECSPCNVISEARPCGREEEEKTLVAHVPIPPRKATEIVDQAQIDTSYETLDAFVVALDANLLRAKSG